MDVINAKSLIRSWRGSPAQIVMAFVFARIFEGTVSMDIKAIHEWTGLKRDTIYQALPALRGYIVLQDTVAHGRDVFTAGENLLPLFQMMIGLVEMPALQESEKRTPGATTTTVKLRELKNKSESLIVAAVDSVPGVRKTDSWKKKFGLDVLEDDDQKAIWRICRKIGIGEPTRTRIARETDYPPEYIWAHGLYGASEGMPVALIIHRIRSEDWLPEHWKEAARGSIDQFFLDDQAEEE